MDNPRKYDISEFKPTWQLLKVAIIGSRKFKDLGLVYDYVMKLDLSDIIVSGGAVGPDSMAAYTADDRGMTVIEYLPDYKNNPPLDAPKLRNYDIIHECDRVVAFWDGQSSGTAHALSIAVNLNKPVEIIYQ